MKHPANCKFCKRQMVLEIDDEYEKLHDPFKLIPFAACDRCADLRTRKRGIEEAITRAVLPLMFAGQAKLQALREQARTELTVLTKKYTAMIADWVGARIPAWDAEMVEGMIENPKNFQKFLKLCWRMYE